MKIMKKIVLLASAILLFASCNDFLQRDPDAQLNSETYFANETSLQTYINGFINSYTPTSALAREDGSDIIAVTRTAYYIDDWNPNVQTGWSSSDWNAIYNINYFLVHLKDVPGLSEATYNHYEATGRFWRALQYWNKVRTFGGVPYYFAPIDADDEEMLYKPRDSREVTMQYILDDLNFACENLSTDAKWVNNAQISRYIALAIKSRICLFEGTYRKYHATNPETGSAWTTNEANKYLTEAADAAQKLMATGRYSIATDYRGIFTKEAPSYTEGIWFHQYNTAAAHTHDLTWYFTSGSMGSKWSGDQDFIQSYLNLDGTPHTTTEEWAQEFQNRDKRLAATFMPPTYTKKIAGASVTTAPDFAVTYTGYQPIKWNIDDNTYDNASISNNSVPIIRYGEVLLNYAEAKAELGQFTEADWNNTIAILRKNHGGITNTAYPTVADPVLAEYYKLSDPVLLEIRRERAIELVFEGHRVNDLMRWARADLINKQWYGLYIPAVNQSYDLNGDGTMDINVYRQADGNGGRAGTPVMLSTANGGWTLENGDHGRLMYNLERKFTEKRYLHPIPASAIVLNPNLEQNAAWK